MNMQIIKLTISCLFLVGIIKISIGKKLKRNIASHGKHKRHSVSGRKGVVEPVSFGNSSELIEAYRNLHFKLHHREKRAANHQNHNHHRHHHHKTAQTRPTSHDNRQSPNITTKYEKQNVTASSGQKKKKFSFPGWIKSIIRAFHLPKPPPDSEARLSWYTTANKKEPFIAEVDMCLLDQCYNQGTCIVDNSSPFGYRCRCPPGIVGDKCEIVIQTCDFEPCQNGGTCKPKNTNSPQKFVCMCNPLYKGKLCEVSLVPGWNGPPSPTPDFFTREENRRPRNLRTENLIAVTMTISVLIIIFVTSFFIFQSCKRNNPPRSSPPKQYKPPERQSSDKATGKSEFGPGEVYCPVVTKVCRMCCPCCVEKEPASSAPHKLTVVKKKSSCRQLSTQLDKEKSHTSLTKLRQTASNSAVQTKQHGRVDTALLTARSSTSHPEVHTSSREELMEDWLSRERAQPKSMATLSTTTTPVSATAGPRITATPVVDSKNKGAQNTHEKFLNNFDDY